MDKEEKPEENYQSNKLIAKMKKDPMIPLGLVGLTSIVIYGIYNFKNKGTQKNSIYLIHLRLAAQGTLMSCITLGLAYQLLRDHIHKFFPEKKN